MLFEACDICNPASVVLSILSSTVPREGFDSSVIMPFSWCVVAVALPM